MDRDNRTPWWRSLKNPALLTALLMGVYSGTPLFLTGSTMKALLKDAGMSLGELGLMGSVGSAYAIKVFWSFLFDRYNLGFLGRRRGWLVVLQTACALAVMGMGSISPIASPYIFTAIAFIVALFSASQDIVIDAFRRESLKEEELGLGNSLYVTGYRLGMIFAGAGALLMAESMSWSTVYLICGLFMLTGIPVTLFAKEPPSQGIPKTFAAAVKEPLGDMLKRSGIGWIFAFVLLFKVGDQLASMMVMPFYMDIGYSKSEIAYITKVVGVIATIGGGLLGGVLMLRWEMRRSLLIFGLLQMASTAGFSLLAVLGKSQIGLALVVIFENVSSGLGTASYAAYLSSLTNRKYTATQYALLTSLMALPGYLLSAPSGFIAEFLGYTQYFMLCTVVAIPGLCLIPFLGRLVSGSEDYPPPSGNPAPGGTNEKDMSPMRRKATPQSH